MGPQECSENLLKVAGSGQMNLVKAFLDTGANIEYYDSQGMHPLHRAVQGGWTDVVRHLIDKGADVNAKTYTGRTALDMASDMKMQDIVQILENKQDLDAPIARASGDQYMYLSGSSQVQEQSLYDRSSGYPAFRIGLGSNPTRRPQPGQWVEDYSMPTEDGSPMRSYREGGW